MARFYKRVYRLTVGTTEITGLDIEFNVTKSTKREPNKAELSVFNLSADRQRAIQASRDTRVTLEAGYLPSGAHLLFRGDVRNAGTPRGGAFSGGREGADTVLKIEAEDSGESIVRARVARSFPPGTRVVTVLGACVDALGLGRGNLRDFESSGLEGAGATFPEGTVLSGWAYQEADNIVRSMGLRWSAQNGVFQLQERNRPLQTQAVLLNESSGLVDIPSIDNTGVVKATSLIQAGLDPGRKVKLESREITGGFEVKSVEYSGSTFSQDWYANLTMKAY